jgi:hypothetical protein
MFITVLHIYKVTTLTNFKVRVFGVVKVHVPIAGSMNIFGVTRQPTATKNSLVVLAARLGPYGKD